MKLTAKQFLLGKRITEDVMKADDVDIFDIIYYSVESIRKEGQLDYLKHLNLLLMNKLINPTSKKEEEKAIISLSIFKEVHKIYK